MSEHKKAHDGEQKQADPMTTATPLTGGTRLLVAMEIDKKFDEATNHYKPGSSDVEIAKSMNVPVEVVRAEREHLFPGSVGEDPSINEFLAGLRGLDVRLPDIDRQEESLSSSASKIDARLAEVEEAQRALRLGVNKFAQDRDWFKSELKRMKEIAEKLNVPFDQRKAG